ncbi:hypothetical protein M9Y10_009255 [Tritrichomonas musculus]|uniref:Myb-like DNA-binding domain containing protein n=1 Tax=Tritrichomonas musculus TaxID=1915356 RepID=A0ABR2IP20_9EUKA
MLKNKRRVFTQFEDQTIREYVLEHGESWEEIAKKLPGRTPKQCHDRFANYLRDGLKTEPWTQEEDEILIEMHKEIGPKWVKMMKRLPGRSGNDIKNRWHKHLIKKEKVTLNQQIKNLDQKVNLNYYQTNNEPINLSEKQMATGSFLIEPIFVNNFQNTKAPETNCNSNPNIHVTKVTYINPPPSNNPIKKVDQYLPLPKVNFNLFDVVDITDRFLEEIFDDLNVKPVVSPYCDQFVNYV